MSVKDIATVLTAVMDGLGHSIRNDYKKEI